MGLYKPSRRGCTQVCLNWVLNMVIPYQTNRLHLYWLSRVAKDADALKRLSVDMYLLQYYTDDLKLSRLEGLPTGRLSRRLKIKSSGKASDRKITDLNFSQVVR